MRPAAGVHASIHVGADQRVTYDGEDLPCYFLVKHADPAIVPNVHTVMYYNRFEDAGGAYGHADFAEHRAYLLARMAAQQPAVYYPESAYWIAFDNSVPLFLPLYVRSRWLDLAGLPGLPGHLAFSSGWDWSYWLHDLASLRGSHALPASHEALVSEAYGSDLGPEAARLVAELAELQAGALIGQRLAPYLAGTRRLDRCRRHDRDPLAARSHHVRRPARRRSRCARRVRARRARAARSLHRRARALARRDPRARPPRLALEPRADRRLRRHRSPRPVRHQQLRDRAAHLAGAPTDEAHARATAALATGAAAILRRHGDLHDTDRTRATGRPANVTVYGYGYLHQADTQRYWKRELVQLDDLLAGSSSAIPHCFL